MKAQRGKANRLLLTGSRLFVVIEAPGDEACASSRGNGRAGFFSPIAGRPVFAARRLIAKTALEETRRSHGVQNAVFELGLRD
jgi:hypothetical protein